MKTIQVTKVVGGGPVDGAIHLQVEQEGTNEMALIVLQPDVLDDLMKALKSTKGDKKEAK